VTQISPNLLGLCRHHWNIPVVAHLYTAAEGNFTAMVDRLSLSRDSLSRTLRYLQSRGWIEDGQSAAYALTRSGSKIAPPCQAILELSREREIRELALRRWTLPIVSALHNWDVQFNQLKVMLPEITPRALTLALKDMQSTGLLHREILPTFPPTPVYRLTPRGTEYLNAIKKL
jgi:DNA-binding HxlR family transcriptional regulator